MKLLTILLAPIVAVGMASTALARDYKDLRLFLRAMRISPKVSVLVLAMQILQIWLCSCGL